MNYTHERIARIARQELSKHRYVSMEDQADAMAAAIITGLREDGYVDRLNAIGAAYDEYNAALKRREHAGVAASRLADVVAEAFTT